MFGKKKYRTKQKSLPKTKPIQGNLSLKITLDDSSFLSFGNAQHQGERSYQEDSFGFSDLSNSDLLGSKGVLAVLADGMGGLSNGKEVSRAVVSEMLNFFNLADTECENGQHLLQLLKRINDDICRKFCSDGQIQAGSTIVSAIINNGFLHWLCVGDSRLYLKRKGMLYQINEDHDYLNDLLCEAMSGEILYEKAFSDPQKDVLTSCVGDSRFPKADYSLNGFEIEKGDIIVLCSDGIYNAVSHERLNALLTSDAQSSAQEIENAVLQQKIQTQDNLTIIVISIN